jgi:hypothetical protein
MKYLFGCGPTVTISSLLSHRSQAGLFTSPSLRRYRFKWRWSVNSLVTCFNWFLFSLNSSFYRGFFKEILNMFLSRCGLPLFVMFPVHPVSDGRLLFARCCRLVQVLWVIWSFFANWSSISFPCPGTHIVFTVLCSANSIRVWKQSQTNLIWHLLSALIAAWP